MHRFAKLAAAAAVVALSSCCSDVPDTTVQPVAQARSAPLRAEYTTRGDGYFDAKVDLDQGPCTMLPADAIADIGGVPLGSSRGGPACMCGSSRFNAYGAQAPAETTGTIRVADSSGETSATVPELFVPPTVALRAPATSLVVGARVYLDFLPANGTILQVVVSYQPQGWYVPAFTLYSSDGSLGHDDAGWYLDVPAVEPGVGDLVASTYSRLMTSSCLGTVECVVTAAATRRLETTVVAP